MPPAGGVGETKIKKGLMRFVGHYLGGGDVAGVKHPSPKRDAH